jgi:OPT family oligopeptide transporter
MVSEALAALVINWRTFVRALKPGASIGDSGQREGIPNSWWIGGLAGGTALTTVLAWFLFGIHPVLTVVAVALSAVLSIVATRSVGECDINPVGGMGKVTQLVFGGLSPGSMSTNLMSAGITAAGATQAADMMQDLKTGYLLGASPRQQFLAQRLGIGAGVFFCIPAFHLFTTAYELGSEKLPAPAAMAWKAMAELLAKGFEALPAGATLAMAAACTVGVAIALLRQNDRIKGYLPSALAVGIAFIVPAYYSLIMFYGVLVWMLWRRKNADSCARFDFAVASGLLVGEGLMGIVNALLTLAGVPPLTE